MDKRYEIWSLTDVDYETAKANGIKKGTLEGRVRRGWDIDTAITIPAHKKEHRIPLHILDLAKENGIIYNTLRTRIFTYDWTYERAATEPPREANKRKRNFSPDYILAESKAVSNGIRKDTFRQRVVYGGWTLEKAATTPTMAVGQYERVKRS